MGLERVGIGSTALPRTDDGAEAAHIGEDPRHRTMVAYPYLDAALNERVGDIGLNVGETDHQIRFETNDVIDTGAGERRYLGLFSPCLWRPHRESGNAHDAIGFADCIEHFR